RAGNRALWLHFVGGNQRDWSVWTASTTRLLPRRLAATTVDVDSPAPMVVGHGDASRFGELLPYAVGRNVVGLRGNGSRARSGGPRGGRRARGRATRDRHESAVVARAGPRRRPRREPRRARGRAGRRARARS